MLIIEKIILVSVWIVVIPKRHRSIVKILSARIVVEKCEGKNARDLERNKKISCNKGGCMVLSGGHAMM
jgi:hypothetical protein